MSNPAPLTSTHPYQTTTFRPTLFFYNQTTDLVTSRAMRFTDCTQVLRGSAVHGIIGRSSPAFYSLRRRGAATRRSLGVVAKIFQPRDSGKGGDNRGDDADGVVSGWTGKFQGFEPLADRKQKDKRKSGKDAAREEEMRGPLDSDDFDAFESFAEAEAAQREANQTV